MKYSVSLVALNILSYVTAQSPIYGQCGGQGWSGTTTCAAGSYCSYSNPYYSQCIPGTGPSVSTVKTTSKTSTTVVPITKTTTAVSTTLSTLTTTKVTTSSSVSTPPASPSSIPHADGRLFNINGKTQYFAGTNTWFMAYISDDSVIDTAFSEIASSGLLVTRVWAFGNVNTPNTNSIYFQVLQQGLNGNNSAINWGPLGIARLDSVVAHAEKYGVKLVMVMNNNWNDLGGINIYTTAFGGSATSWYTDATSQTTYQNYVKFIINRYKNSPAVFSWELMNEPRCNGCPTSVITNWATTTSKYIKSLDSTHMVALGDEGWFAPADGIGDGSYGYGGGEGIDFVANLKIPTLDYGTVHLYPDSWGYNETWGSTWISQHDAVGKSVGKPVVLEEYGYGNGAKQPVELPWQQTVLSSGIAADMFWQWGNTATQNMEDPNAIFYDTTTGSDYQVLVLQHAKAMAAKSVTQ